MAEEKGFKIPLGTNVLAEVIPGVRMTLTIDLSVKDGKATDKGNVTLATSHGSVRVPGTPGKVNLTYYVPPEGGK